MKPFSNVTYNVGGQPTFEVLDKAQHLGCRRLSAIKLYQAIGHQGGRIYDAETINPELSGTSWCLKWFEKTLRHPSVMSS